MIEKLPEIQIHSCAKINEKLNEVINAVNAIQKEREAERFEIQEWIGILEAVRKSVNVHEKQIDELQMKVEPEKCETPIDPFAEQRKWIGKLCRFWDDDPNDCCFDKLKEITFAGCYIKESGFMFEHCEPVLPTDNAIYKGGNNAE